MKDKTRTKKVAFVTLGCKLNFSETATISRQFSENGYQVVKQSDKADIYVINTCSVTSMAEKKCRQAINKIKKNSPNAKIVAIGCYAQLRGRDIAAIPGVDLVLGTNQKFHILDHLGQERREAGSGTVISCEINQIRNFDAAYSISERTRSFLKVQDGCDYFCSYCTIPYARGRSRNESIANIVERAKRIADSGVKEIILSGVNTGDFGKSTNETFFDLVKALDRVGEIDRIRISSIEPNLLSDEIITFTAESQRFMPHFHIPLQAGSDKILKLMCRRYSTELFADRIYKIKQYIPDAFIGVDIIAGFPGETDNDFNQAKQLLFGLDVSFLHIFPYSERPGTKAVLMKGKVKNSVITQRCNELKIISDNKHQEFCRSFINTTRPVLFESMAKNNTIMGFTDNYIKVTADYSNKTINKIINVELKSLNPDNSILSE